MVLNMHRADKKGFAQRYGVAYIVMDSWLRTLNYVRNCCAHHARLWNRALAIKPLIPHEKHRPEFHKPPVRNSRIFAVLTIVQYLLNIVDPSHRWHVEVLALLNRFPNIPVEQMGFPEGWQELPMWRK